MSTVDIKENEVGVYALGGLGEIGKNTYGIQYQDEIIVVDAGIKFPEDSLLGIDYVIPDYSYLVENIDKVKALVITHGHEDHIGAIAYFLQAVNVPVYAGPLAMALIRNKLEEKQLLNRSELHEITDGSVIEFDQMSVEFIRTTHSIPDVFAVSVKTPVGTIVETGDFKFDLTPTTKQKPNLWSMARTGEEGVLLLMSDSTNAERPEWTKSEAWVEKTVQKLFEQLKHGRIIFATFASNMNRIKMATDAAIAHGRKIAVFGRSMESAMTNGRALGYLNIPDDALIEQSQIKNIPDDELLILSTGSQGESMAALARIANGTHKQVRLKPNDNVIFSSSPIPGNTASVNAVINKLEEGGANVIHGKLNNIHTSGHGGQEEQKLMLSLMKPEYFMPVHGEYRMLKVHAGLAEELDIPKDHTFILENGDVLALDGVNPPRIAGHFPAEDTYIDGSGIGDIGSIVLHDRLKLSQDGLVIVTATIDLKKKEILSGPDILSRGFVYMRESGDLINDGRHVIFNTIRKAMSAKNASESDIRQAIIDDLAKYLHKETARKPMILPMLIMI
ncbi:ribonuclease J1 [Fructobacillus evanidus]|uniref:Ribonuclease J n=1 Tax=Fructobacillus evanidus TaxID=3064281 RepID=A0ABM9MQV0_9LACO|nr:mRNA degradation ribonuclease J1/J2 (RnjA) [Fructobacillus sp. LMG 32999]CAK1230986.1 mRNA degradation ribonuclease J1/J2 (RnjA) [Fructobacillus sp. LMG 32999]CAK1233652.1 mRNA degradation ribonuclease J1/J2 (RnjA) [Fructobacillus sp. LMG 32999]CAK1236894.1 mRNA degradation ribonuclease J1/J2 (RnjA) [Fructobacillus sp. LMG 32999]CAK1237662.1 mRNA degradation ribonuclease J1/J2 (RnjA) [Fructobacillus sp. LMG 32999]